MKKFLNLFFIFIFLFSNSFSKNNESIVKIALGYSGRSYDPHKHTDSSTLAITKQIYNNLFILKNNILEGELAENYSIETLSAGENSIKIKIKENIFFQNNEELTSEVVKKSLERNKKIPITKVLVDPISKVNIIDKYNLEIITSTSPSILLHNLTHSSLAIINEKNEKLSGTGPFKLFDWGNGTKVILEKNSNYFKGEPQVDSIIFLTIPEAPNRFIALETGEVDISYDISAIDVKKYDNSMNFHILNELSYGTDFLSINTSKTPLNDKNIREAISLALDKKAINEAIFENTSIVANSIITPNTFGFSNQNLKEYNLEKAKKIMSKYKIPITIDLWIYEDTSKYQMAQIIQSNLKEIGINVNIEVLELSSFLQLSAQGNHNALIGLWYTSTGDADYGYYPLLHKSSFGGVGNRSFYDNPKVNSLLDSGRSELSLDNRKVIYEEIHKIISEENPIIPIVYKVYNIGISNNVENFEFNPNGNHILEKIKIKK